ERLWYIICSNHEFGLFCNDVYLQWSSQYTSHICTRGKKYGGKGFFTFLVPHDSGSYSVLAYWFETSLVLCMARVDRSRNSYCSVCRIGSCALSRQRISVNGSNNCFDDYNIRYRADI